MVPNQLNIKLDGLSIHTGKKSNWVHIAPTECILFELTKPFEMEIEKQISNYGTVYRIWLIIGGSWRLEG